MKVRLNQVSSGCRVAVATVLLSVLFTGAAASAQATRDFTRPLSAEQKIAHAINRLTFGARPGDVERVRAMGLNRWIEGQLNPETIDIKPLETKLSALKALRLPPEKLMLAQNADNGQFQKKLRDLEQQKRQQAQGRNTPLTPVEFTPQEERLRAQLEAANIELQTSYQALGELQFDKITRAIESERQLYEIMVDFWSNHFNLDAKKNAVRVLKVVDEREVVRPHVFGRFRDMLGASAKSPAMLIYLDNASSTREREMAAPRGRRARRQNQAAPNAPAANMPVRRRGGINENYARELMELHTLGVDGGYTQQDVQNVARCFTGWSLNRQTGQFLFRREAHDQGEKTVLGHTIPANGGMSDGEKVLDILAAHPATAKFIARKLCVRLVADEPPATLVDKAAGSFTATDGDLRAVVKTIVTSPEFFSTGAYRAKIKSPFEYAVSAVRALGGVVLMPDTRVRAERLSLVSDGRSSGRGGGGGGYGARRPQKTMAVSIGDMGQPLYSYQAPTGYSEDSREWVSTGALVARLNYALALVSNDIFNVVTTPALLLKGVDEHDHAAMVERLAQTILNGDISPGTRAVLVRETGGPGAVDRNKLTALVLGSPEFQRR